jgi:hypothetical protein
VHVADIALSTSERVARTERTDPVRRPQGVQNFQQTFTADAATNHRFRIRPPAIDTAITLLCIATMNYCNATNNLSSLYFKRSWRIDVKKISVSFAAAVVAMTAVTGAVAAELPSYEKAGLPVSAVQLQVMGAEGVSEQPPVALSATPVQLSVLTPRHKTKTVGLAVH